MESSQWAKSNSAPNFGVMTPLVVKIGIKKIIWHFFQFFEKPSKADLIDSIWSEKEVFR